MAGTTPRLTGITADSAGLLWVSVGVADRAWTAGMDARKNVEGTFDTRVLVIDPAKRAVVGTVQLDPVCLPIEGRLISCVDEVEQSIHIMVLELERRRSARR